MNHDGFYAAYLSGRAGEGIALLTFQRGVLVGCDMSGTTYDGRYAVTPDGRALDTTIIVRIPPGTPLAQGGIVPDDKRNFELRIQIPLDPDVPYLRIETPNGPANVRLQKLRNIDPIQ